MQGLLAKMRRVQSCCHSFATWKYNWLKANDVFTQPLYSLVYKKYCAYHPETYVKVTNKQLSYQPVLNPFNSIIKVSMECKHLKFASYSYSTPAITISYLNGFHNCYSTSFFKECYEYNSPQNIAKDLTSYTPCIVSDPSM